MTVRASNRYRCPTCGSQLQFLALRTFSCWRAVEVVKYARPRCPDPWFRVDCVVLRLGRYRVLASKLERA